MESGGDYGYWQGILDNDSDIYLPGYYQYRIEVTQQQVDSMLEFFDNPESEGFGVGDYDPVHNACVDFVWMALRKAGLNPEGFEGSLFPENNLEDLQERIPLAPHGHLIGNQQNNNIDGEDGDDDIYGLNGDDVLYGGIAGRDRLVGGLGADILRGGDENDVLIGGLHINNTINNTYINHDDTTSDRLEGGLGDDLYYAGVSDVICDEDSKGLIYYDVTLADGSHIDVDVSSSFWMYESVRDDGYYSVDIESLGITLNYIYDEANQNLRIYQDSQSNNSLTIEQFTDGDFGINLNTPVSSDSYWFVWINSRGRPSQPVEECYLSYDPWWYVAEHGSRSELLVDDNFVVTEADDVVDTGGGDDTVHALAGSDQVSGGVGNDCLFH